MTDGGSGTVQRPQSRRGGWTSFVAAIVAPGRKSRTLHEASNPHHRVRVEHDNHTLLVHVSDETGHGWTTLAIDRDSRAWSVAQRDSQIAAATAAASALYNA